LKTQTLTFSGDRKIATVFCFDPDKDFDEQWQEMLRDKTLGFKDKESTT